MKDWDAIKLLAKYPLKELRRRQLIAEEQAKIAYKTRNIVGLESAQHQQDLLAAAVELRCFEQKQVKKCQQ